MFIAILFIFFAGLGSNLSSLSPYVLGHFGEKGEWIFIAIQLSMPIGNLFAGWISDKTKKIRILLFCGLLLLPPTQYFLFSYSENWVITLFLAGFQRFLLSANYQWITIGAMEAKGEHKFSKIRSSGTMGFLFIQLLLYILTMPDSFHFIKTPADTGKLGSFFYLFCLIPALQFPKNRISGLEYRFRDAFKLIQNPKFFYFFLLSFFFYSAYQVTDNYMGRFFQITIGLNGVFLSWLVAVLFEIPFLLFVGRIVHHFGIISLFFIAIICGVFRFSFMVFTGFHIDPDLIMYNQLFHAFLFAGYYMGCVLWLRKNSPSHLYGSVYGLFSILSQSLGGMFGNLLCGKLLHLKLGTQLSQMVGRGVPEHLDFFPIFLFCMIVFISLFLGFLLFSKKFPIHAHSQEV